MKLVNINDVKDTACAICCEDNCKRKRTGICDTLTRINDIKVFDLDEHNKQARADMLNEIKSSLNQASYQYDETMSIDNNIGSAMLGEYAKGYSKGHEDKCSKIRAEAIDDRASLLAFICKKYNIPLLDMNCTVDEWEELKEGK